MTHPIRPACEADIERLVEFEIEIAIISFGDEAITDPAVHRKRVTQALGKGDEVMLVAGEPGTPALGWAWLSGRRNSLTGQHYGNFRSLAAADHPDRAEIGEALLAEVIRRCREAGISELVGKVHATNLPMRALYRKFDFEAVHVTMRKRLDEADA